MTHFLLSRYLLKAFVLEVAFYQPFKAPRGWDYFEFPHTYQEECSKKQMSWVELLCLILK
jgi:hypothetical protein